MSLDLELSELKQKSDEPLDAYYGRASTLLARMDAKNRGPSVSLSLMKSTMMDGVTRTFILGIHDRKVQKEISKGLFSQNGLLRRIYILMKSAGQI